MNCVHTSKRRVMSALAAVSLTLPAAGAELLWNNGLEHNRDECGLGSGRAISPPSFPDIRVADDFVVPDGGWLIEQISGLVIEDTTFERGDRLTLFIYADAGDRPGEITHEITGDYVHVATGETYYGRAEYQYWLEDLDLQLDEGEYWLGLRNPDGAGSGTNYWLCSCTPQGQQSSTGYFALDGVSWTTEGAGWHHGFQLFGVPEPHSAMLLTLGAITLIRRSTRRSPPPR